MKRRKSRSDEDARQHESAQLVFEEAMAIWGELPMVWRCEIKKLVSRIIEGPLKNAVLDASMFEVVAIAAAAGIVAIERAEKALRKGGAK